jgi:hypothetical protein
MNTLLKFDPQGRPNFQLEQSDLRSHCEHVAWDTLPSVAAALVLPIAAMPDTKEQ